MSANEKINIRYLDHRTNRYDTLTIDPISLVLRLIEHIPDKHFRMIRYFGFLSNRRRKEMLPKVYESLEQEIPTEIKTPTYAAMLKSYVKVDPFECILCGGRMLYSGFRKGVPISKKIEERMMKAKMCSV